MESKIHPIKLSNGMKTFKGQLVIGKDTLYFLCYSKGNALLESAALSQGMKSGGILSSLINAKSQDRIDASINEDEILQLVEELSGSLTFKANDIDKLQHNMFLRYIKYKGKKMGVPSGFPKALRKDLKPWADRHSIRTSGF